MHSSYLQAICSLAKAAPALQHGWLWCVPALQFFVLSGSRESDLEHGFLRVETVLETMVEGMHGLKGGTLIFSMRELLASFCSISEGLLMQGKITNG